MFAEQSHDGSPTSDSVDRRIARLLWVWAHNQEYGENVEQQLSVLLEAFFCDSFSYYSEAAKQGWWFDGVMDLRIQRNGKAAFRVIGLTWWSDRNAMSHRVAPFEVEFYFDTEDSLDFGWTDIRLGWRDKDGIIRSSCSIHPRLREEGRPNVDSNWAMAIELTPPEHE